MNNEKIKKHHHHTLPLKTLGDYINKREFKVGTPVWLNIYHITCLNYILQFIGLGIFHSTIEIESFEYSFGATKEDIPGFYFSEHNTLRNKLKLKERIYLGNTLYSKKTFENLLILIAPYWMGRTYDPFVKNCNHFTKHLADLLLYDNQYFPLYINRIAKYGILFSAFYPPVKILYGNFEQRITKSSEIRSWAKNINSYNERNIRGSIFNNLAYGINNCHFNHSHKTAFEIKVKELINDNSENNKEKNDFSNYEIIDKSNKKILEKSNQKTNEKSKDKISELRSEDIKINMKFNEDEENIVLYNTLAQIIKKNGYYSKLNYNIFNKTNRKKYITKIPHNAKKFLELLKKTEEEFSAGLKIIENVDDINELEENHNKSYNKFQNKLSSSIMMDNDSSFCYKDEINIGSSDDLRKFWKFFQLDYNRLKSIEERVVSCLLICSKLETNKTFEKINEFITLEDVIDKKSYIYYELMKLNKGKEIFYSFIRLKLFHMLSFIHLLNKDISGLETVTNQIIKIDPNDFFGLYLLIFVRYVQLRLPESSEIFSSLLKNNENTQNPVFINALSFFSGLLQFDK